MKIRQLKCVNTDRVKLTRSVLRVLIYIDTLFNTPHYFDVFNETKKKIIFKAGMLDKRLLRVKC